MKSSKDLPKIDLKIVSHSSMVNNGKPKTFFNIRVEVFGLKYQLARRFNDFVLLHE